MMQGGARLDEELAHQRDEACARHVRQIAEEAPSSNPAQDQELRRLASENARQAMEAYRFSLQRFTNYVVHGIVPEDLRDK
jgi:hypothetical protein